MNEDSARYAVREGASGLSRAELGKLGLGGREIRELLAKIEAPERPDFSLDLGRMQRAEEMEAKMLAAVPEPERDVQGPEAVD